MYKILCVDDTPSNIFSLEALFLAYNDKYEIITASSGYEALEILLKTKIDLLLLDVMMPQMNGFEVATLIKKNVKTKDIPILFITAKNDDETIATAFKIGVDYLPKPFNEAELLARVSFHLEMLFISNNLKKEIYFNKSILDYQENIILVYEKDTLSTVNKSFLKFFNCKDTQEFTSKYNCITDLFIEQDSYFSIKNITNESTWIESLIGMEQNNVLINNPLTSNPRVFKIIVNNIMNSEKFIVSLTDITTILNKSKEFENKANYDSLTKVYSRSKFDELFNSEIVYAKLHNTSL